MSSKNDEEGDYAHNLDSLISLHVMTSRIFTSTIDRKFIRAPNMMMKVATDTIWIH